MEVLGKVADQSYCTASIGNTKMTDLVLVDDSVLLTRLLVLVMALEMLLEEAKPLGLKVSGT